VTNPQNIAITVTGEELTYLRTAGFLPQKLFDLLVLARSVNFSQYLLRLSREDAEQFHAALTDQVARVGFDEEYELNQDGEMLEELIDRLFRASQS
jgi:hypothetical protein